MTFDKIGFATYQPDQEDLCSLCGGNFGKVSMIECKDKIHICMECVDLLGAIKKERDNKKRDETETALRTCLAGTGAGITPLAANCIYEAIAAGKIPHIRIN